MRAPLGSSLGRHLLASLVALTCAVALEGTADAASCIPGFDYAGFGINVLNFQGGATTNSYDSAIGPYPAGILGSGGDLGTNGGCPNLGGAGVIGGNVVAGEGTACAAPTTPQAPGTEPVFPPVSIPATIPALRGNCSDCTMNTTTGNTWGNISASNGNTVTMTAGTYIVTGDFKTVPGGTINITGPVIMYLTCATGAVDVKGTITTLGNKASNFVIMAANACTDIKINGGANAAFALYAPNAQVELNGGGEIYGSIVGKELKINGGAKVHYDRALKNLEVGNLSCAKVEISRATPIIATVGGGEVMVQGTYESPIPAIRPQVLAAADLATFAFPYIPGHLRARPVTGLTGIKDFTDATATQWDGATGIPPVTLAGCTTSFTPTCRTVFTNAASGLSPANLIFNTGTNATAVAALLKGAVALTAVQEQTLIGKILAGGPGNTPRLGGIDRSTVAVIPPSLVAGGPRPTMAYVGGTDGMLHAFCAADHNLPAAGACVRGKELWAFAPRTLLADLRLNNAIIDGSPRVVDMFGKFGGTTASFRTILTFTTGSGERTLGKTPAVYALDVTDPTNPKVLWEYTWNPTSVRAYELGKGQTLAQTVISVAGVKKNVVYAQTNNGQSLQNASAVVGAGLPGTVLVAIDVETGTDLFAPVGYPYTNPPRGAGTAVPYTGVPGGAVALELTGAGFSDALVFGTLYGEMWVVDPATGASKYGTSPLFRFTTNGKPVGAAPSIYKDAGVSYAVGVTGAYWDRSGSSEWGTAATQHGFAVRLGLPASTSVPLTESTGSPNVPFVADFTGGKKLGAQALIVGNEVFFTAETANINSTGYASTATPTGSVASYNVTSGASVGSDTTVIAGVGSLAKSTGGGVFASGARGTEKLYNASVSGGQKVTASSPKLTRRLWLRTL